MENLITEEFKELCVVNQVEVSVKPLPNPGDPYNAIKMLEIRSFNDSVVCVTQCNRKFTQHFIPARGSIQMILKPDEDLPNIEKVIDAN